jgi:hypothetical protein
MPRFVGVPIAALLALSAFVLLPQCCRAQIVWSGFTKSFSKPDDTDGSLPQYQDPLSASVVLTRLSSGGMVNISAETSYNQLSSPKLTEWATNLNNASQTIAATNWQNLTFTNWINAYGGSHSTGSSIAGRDAVVHLIPDNIYLDLRFTSWTTGVTGGFAYTRAEPPAIPTPTGDYNHNGTVDAADYVVWRRTLNQTGVPAGSGADGSANGTIDADDYTFWRQRFGNSAGLGAGPAVPEPAALATLLLGFAFCSKTRINRLRRRPTLT